MAQKFRNGDDLDVVAPTGLVTEGGDHRLSNGRTRHASIYVPSTPTDVDENLLVAIEAADRKAMKATRPRQPRRIAS